MEVDQSSSLASEGSSDLEDEDTDDFSEDSKCLVENNKINNCIGENFEDHAVDEKMSIYNNTNEKIDIQNKMSDLTDKKDIVSLAETLQHGPSIVYTSSPSPRENSIEETNCDQSNNLEDQNSVQDKDPSHQGVESLNSKEEPVQNQFHMESTTSVTECTENHLESNVNISPSVNINETSNVNLLPTQTFPMSCDDNSNSSSFELDKPPDDEVRVDSESQHENKNSSGVHVENEENVKSDNSNLSSKGLDRIGEHYDSTFNNIDEKRPNNEDEKRPNNEIIDECNVTKDSPSDSKPVVNQPSNMDHVETHPHSVSNDSINTDELPPINHNSDTSPNNGIDSMSTSDGESLGLKIVNEVSGETSHELIEEEIDMSSEDNSIESLEENPSKSFENVEESTEERTEKHLDERRENKENGQKDEVMDDKSSATVQPEIDKHCDKLVDYEGSDDDDLDLENSESEQDDSDTLTICDDEVKSRGDLDKRNVSKNSQMNDDLTESSNRNHLEELDSDSVDSIKETPHGENLDLNTHHVNKSTSQSSTQEIDEEQSIELTKQLESKEIKTHINETHHDDLSEEDSSIWSSEEETESFTDETNSQFTENKIEENVSDIVKDHPNQSNTLSFQSKSDEILDSDSVDSIKETHPRENLDLNTHHVSKSTSQSSTQEIDEEQSIELTKQLESKEMKTHINETHDDDDDDLSEEDSSIWSSEEETESFTDETNSQFTENKIEENVSDIVKDHPKESDTPSVQSKSDEIPIQHEPIVNTSSQHTEESTDENSNDSNENKIEENLSDIVKEHPNQSDTLSVQSKSDEIPIQHEPIVTTSSQHTEESTDENSNDSDGKSITNELSIARSSNDSESSEDCRNKDNSVGTIKNLDCDEDPNSVTKASSSEHNTDVVKNIEALLLEQNKSQTSQTDILKQIEDIVCNTSLLTSSESYTLNKIVTLIKDGKNVPHEIKTGLNNVTEDRQNILEKIEKIIERSCKNDWDSSHHIVNEVSHKVDTNETESIVRTNEDISTKENNVEGLEMGVCEESDEDVEEPPERSDIDSHTVVKKIEETAMESEPLLSNPLKRKLDTNSEDSMKSPPAKKQAMSCDVSTLLQNGTIDEPSLLSSERDVNVSSKPISNDLKPGMIVPKNTNHLLKNISPPRVPNSGNALDKICIDPLGSSKPSDSGKPLTRKVFLCAACHVYFEYWNLYLHMLEYHKRFICLYCLGMFGNSSNLSDHLLKHHNLHIKHIAAGNCLGYKEYTNEKYILTCTTCGSIVQNNDLVNHTCSLVSDKDKSRNRSLDSSSESYPDPESFMLATMTEGDDKASKNGSVQVITVEDTMKGVSRISPVVSSADSRMDKLMETINEVAENRSQQSRPESDIPSRPKSPPTTDVIKVTSHPEEVVSVPLREEMSEPTNVEPSPKPATSELSASAVLSQLENCHKLVIGERTSGDETESDLEESLLNKSIEGRISETHEHTKENEPEESGEKESSATDESTATIEKDYLERSRESIFDTKGVLDKLGLTPEKSSRDLPETTSTSCEEGKSVGQSVVGHSDTSTTVTEMSNTKAEDMVTHISHSSPEKENLNVSEDMEDDDNREDFNDSDNENSLKIDDSVFEDDEEDQMESAQEVAGSKSIEETHEEKLAEPAFKINPLRIKIKCGPGNTGDTYERIKTETEIKEKEARERRYDEAIDEAIRKSVMYVEEREASEAQKEKEEYERLQQELAKKQEEYQRIQAEYQTLQANESKEEDQLEDTGEEERENESTEHDESIEETTTEQREEHTETEEMNEHHEDEKVDVDVEDRVKLIERSNDEKASLLKEELLKKCEKLFAGVDQLPEEEQETEPTIELASEDIQPMALSLDEKLDSLDIRVVIKECVRTSCSICVYCYHATRIVVNGKQLALHILAEHRYTPVKNDTSEDLINFIKTNMPQLENEFFSSDTFDPTDSACFKAFDNIYYCLQCSFASKHQRELTSHKRKMHPKTSQICLLCKQILLNQSELLFHYCTGVNNPKPQDNIYWCGVCGLDKIPSAFRLMVHLRKKHNTCNVCLEACTNESKLLQHMLKHKIIHMCYKCNISYRNKQDITKHLFWKHGTESIVCKKCLQKRWSHVYHFCQPPARFTCDECNLMFKKSVSLKVHKRIHSGIYPYECTEEGCEEKFVSRKLLDKHAQWHQEPPKPPTPPPQDTHSSEPHIDVCNVDDGPNPVQDLKQSSKSKKKKKSKFDLNNMNLPPLNLSSDSDSSDEDVPSVSPGSIPLGDDANAEVAASTEPAAASEGITPDVVVAPAEPAPLSTESEAATSKQDDIPVPEIDKPESSQEGITHPGVNMPDLTDEPFVPAPPADPCESPEEAKVSVPPVEEHKASLPPLEDPEHVPEIVPDVWDQFKSFTQSLNVFRHVEEEHDYHVVYERPREEELPPPPLPVPEPEPIPDVAPGETDAETPAPVEMEEGEREPAVDKSADTTLNKTTSDDSSSDSSSSSSCGSQCGSNCSCSSSSSSSSSSSEDSSSDSDSSDPENRKRQEEKRAAKKAEKRKKTKKHHNASDEVNVTIENTPPRHSPRHSPEPEVTTPHPVAPKPLPPPIHESDLDTEVSSSDEDFYDEKPQLAAPRPEEKPLPPHSPPPALPATSPPPASPPHHSLPYALPQPVLPPITPVRTPSRTPKKRKRPRMRNVPTSTPKAPAPAFKTSFKHPFMRPSPAFETKKPPQLLISSFADTPPPAVASDDNTRSSKRKRKQNRFYGYSDEEEDTADYDNDESDEFSLVKHPPLKKKLLWKRPCASFSDKIPLPPASPPPPPYESKIRIENPFRKSSTEYETSSPAPEYPSPYHARPESPLPPPSSSSSSESEPEPYVVPPVTYAPPPSVPVPLYCYCRCPYDEVSEMIACDGDDCEIEWYHFECVNILVPPKGKWYCPQCRPKYQPF